MSVQGNVVHSDNLVGWLVTQLVALGALLASLAGWIPYAIIAAIPTIYYLLMIWEMRTVQHALNNWRTKRIAKKYAKAQARAKIALARLEAIDVIRNARHEARDKVEQAAADAAKLVIKQTADAKTKLPPV
jgi:hypothetical protein